MKVPIRFIDIPREDIINMDYSSINDVIQKAETDKKNLEREKNSWEIIFSDYMTDPRPLPDIPEVIDWINGSVDAGIPWFYFLRTGIYPQGLQLLLACGAKTEALSPDGSYLINIKKFRTFVLKNLSNLHAYIDKNGFPSESGDGIVNAVMCIVKEYVH